MKRRSPSLGVPGAPALRGRRETQLAAPEEPRQRRRHVTEGQSADTIEVTNTHSSSVAA